MFSIEGLFAAARANPQNPMNQPGRLMGRHCQARLQRAKAKRIKAGHTPYNPASPMPAGGV